MRKNVERDYEQNLGRPAVTRYPPGHPDAWQWSYEGRTDEEKRLLLDLLQEEATAAVEEQESLF
jgi:hypothetical protein